MKSLSANYVRCAPLRNFWGYDMAEIEIIGLIRSDFPTKFGIPRQSGVCPNLEARIEFLPEYSQKEAFRGLEEFSHIWVLWQFSECKDKEFSPTVRPPKLGGNKRMGVFATRSPFRPNNIGISSVELERIEYTEKGVVLYIKGADMMDLTPVIDIKPYIPYADSHPTAKGGFSVSKSNIKVSIPKEILGDFPESKIDALKEVLAEDPRPGYIDDERDFGFRFSGYEIVFSVSDDILIVKKIEKKLLQ